MSIILVLQVKKEYTFIFPIIILSQMLFVNPKMDLFQTNFQGTTDIDADKFGVRMKILTQ